MHKIECECGKLQGQIVGDGTCNRLVCYCADCRAFAKFLGRAEAILDAKGGTEIVQIAQPRVDILRGKDYLAAVRLSSRGLVRLYANCCNTPLGNILANPKCSFIGLIHSCLDRSMIDQDFGEKVAKVNVDSATGSPKPQQQGLPGVFWRFAVIILSARFRGRYLESEFFDESGSLIVAPTILTREERKAL